MPLIGTAPTRKYSLTRESWRYRFSGVGYWYFVGSNIIYGNGLFDCQRNVHQWVYTQSANATYAATNGIYTTCPEATPSNVGYTEPSVWVLLTRTNEPSPRGRFRNITETWECKQGASATKLSD